MIRNLKIFLCVLCLVFTLCLFSCSKDSDIPTDADEFVRALDSKFESLGSYAADINIDMLLKVNGNNAKMTSEGRMITSGLKSEDDYYYFDELITETKISSGNAVSATEVTAYVDGEMFFGSMESGEEAVMLRSKTSREDFLGIMNDADEEDVDMSVCAEKEFSRSQHGDYFATFSGYSKSKIYDIAKMFGIYDVIGSLDVELYDVRLSIGANKSLMADRVQVEFIFDDHESANPSKIDLTMEIHSYNKAVREEINKENYKEVDDIAILFNIEKQLKEKVENSGTFKLVNEQSGTNLRGDKILDYKEQSAVSYGERNGSFFYDINCTITGTGNVKIQYENGYQWVTLEGGQPASAIMTEAVARAYIRSLIYSSFSLTAVTDVTIDSDGGCKVKIKESAIYDTCKSAIEGFGDSYKSASAFVKFFFTDSGEITRVQTLLVVSGQRTTINSESVATFG